MRSDLRTSSFAKRFVAFNLFVAFAFTVMADPVSSVTYAIEAALAGLDGDLGSIVWTMAIVIGAIALVSVGYHGLIARFPDGGGGAEGLAAAFGEGWAFLPLGALLVDFTLTIAVSCAAGTSALIAYLPQLAPSRVPIALALVVLVGGATLFGHRARVAFATATLVFIGAVAVVLVLGARTAPAANGRALVADGSFVSILLAMPLGMALATGVEAPSNAIAQLGQLDARGRRRFGQLTMWLMVLIVGCLTFGLAVLTVHLGVGEPGRDSTLLADVARQASGEGALFAIFQSASGLLLLGAAASSYLAGSGLLKALAFHGADGDGLLPERFRRINRNYVPHWGVAALVAISGVLVAVSGGREQSLVHFYAVAVFLSFLGALVAATVLARRDGMVGRTIACGAGALVVALVLVLNTRRVDPLVSLAASGAISLFLWRAWVRRGRPGGVATLARV